MTSKPIDDADSSSELVRNEIRPRDFTSGSSKRPSNAIYPQASHAALARMQQQDGGLSEDEDEGKRTRRTSNREESPSGAHEEAHTSGSGSRSDSQEGDTTSASHDAALSSTISNVPGMSGIISRHSHSQFGNDNESSASPPQVAHNYRSPKTHAGPVSSLHFSRIGTSSSTGEVAGHARTRRSSHKDRVPLTSPRVGSHSASSNNEGSPARAGTTNAVAYAVPHDKRGTTQYTSSTSVSSGTGGSSGIVAGSSTGSGGSGSAWSFFRSSSASVHAGQERPGAPRHAHSDSLSSLHRGHTLEPILSPVMGTSGYTTPIAPDYKRTDSQDSRATPDYDEVSVAAGGTSGHASGSITPMHPPGAASELQDRMRATIQGIHLRLDETSRNNSRNRPSQSVIDFSASYEIGDSASSQSSSSYASIAGSTYSTRTSSRRQSTSISGRNSGSATPVVTAPGAQSGSPSDRLPTESVSGSRKRKADGLVAMAIRPQGNTLDDAKVVVAGRSVLKILAIKNAKDVSPDDSDPVSASEGEHDHLPRQQLQPVDSRFSRYTRSSFSRSRSTSRSQSPMIRAGRTYVKVEEQMDLQSGLLYTGGKNSKAALINDVSWGYDYTADKILTGNSNGTVALYDIEKSSGTANGNKLERLKTHHISGRAVNVVSFAGPVGQGTLLASGCQDGDIMLSDVRHTSLITLSTPLDPVRTFCFPPRKEGHTTADPFHVISAHESGQVARWDLRQPKQPIERWMAHQGGVLSIDWRGSTHQADPLMTAVATSTGAATGEGGDEGFGANPQIAGTPELKGPGDSSGWLASAGRDGTVKIWDMSTSVVGPKLVHTLQVNRPVQFVRWMNTPERPCDVVILPLTQGSAIGAGALDGDWQPDMEIWDVRREFVPRRTFWTNGAPVGALSPYSNPNVIWTLNRQSAAFQQIDITREAVLPMEYYPKVATAWSPDGTLAFAVNNRRADDLPAASTDMVRQASTARNAPDDPSPLPDQTSGVVSDMDPDFDVHTFRYLADEYRFRSNPSQGLHRLSDICEHNADTALTVQKYDAAKVWKLVAQWIAGKEIEDEREQVQAATPALTESKETVNTKATLSPVDSKTELASSVTSPAGVHMRKSSKSHKSPAVANYQGTGGEATYTTYSARGSPLSKSQVLPSRPDDPDLDFLSPPMPHQQLTRPSSRQQKDRKEKETNYKRRENAINSNTDLVGSDTSSSSYADTDFKHHSPESDGRNDVLEEVLSQSRVELSEDEKEEIKSALSSNAMANPVMPLSAVSLLTRKKPALPTLSRSNTADALAFGGQLQSSALSQFTSSSNANSSSASGDRTPTSYTPGPVPPSRLTLESLGSHGHHTASHHHPYTHHNPHGHMMRRTSALGQALSLGTPASGGGLSERALSAIPGSLSSEVGRLLRSDSQRTAKPAEESSASSSGDGDEDEIEAEPARNLDGRLDDNAPVSIDGAGADEGQQVSSAERLRAKARAKKLNLTLRKHETAKQTSSSRRRSDSRSRRHQTRRVVSGRRAGDEGERGEKSDTEATSASRPSTGGMRRTKKGGKDGQAASRSVSRQGYRNHSKAKYGHSHHHHHHHRDYYYVNSQQQLQMQIDRYAAEAAVQKQSEMKERMKRNILQAMVDMAEEGDVQTSTTLAFVLRDALQDSSSVQPGWLARITTAYLRLLQLADAHLPSASLIKHSKIDSIKTSSLENTTLHTACGNCEKGIHNAPFGRCRKCSAQVTLCSICHEVETDLFIFCATCGHGAHEECLYTFASEIYSTSLLSDIMRSEANTPSGSIPPSPVMSLSQNQSQSQTPDHWLYPSEQALFTHSSYFPILKSRPGSPERDPESKKFLLDTCPSGCGHACLLDLPLAVQASGGGSNAFGGLFRDMMEEEEEAGYALTTRQDEDDTDEDGEQEQEAEEDDY